MTGSLVGLFKGQSQYGAVRAHVDDLAEALREEGCRTLTLDYLSDDFLDQIMHMVQQSQQVPPAFVHGMLGWGSEAKAGGRSLYDVLGCPFIHHMQDQPYFLHPRLLHPIAQHKIAVHDSAYESYLQRIPGLTPDRRILTCGGSAPPEPVLPFEVRDIDVLISMSVTPMAELTAQLAALPYAQRRLVKAIIEEVLDTPDVAVHDVGFRLMAKFGIETWYAEPDKHAGHLLFARQVLTTAYVQIHALRRLRLAPQLLELPAIIHGSGWESIDVPSSRAVLRGPVDFREIQRLTGRSRIALNVMPPVNDAPHDRTFYAMLAGAVYLTDPNDFFRREYWEGDEICYFDLRTTTLVDEVQTLLADSVKLTEIAAAGCATTAERHTWRHRARELLAFAEAPTPECHLVG